MLWFFLRIWTQAAKAGNDEWIDFVRDEIRNRKLKMREILKEFYFPNIYKKKDKILAFKNQEKKNLPNFNEIMGERKKNQNRSEV